MISSHSRRGAVAVLLLGLVYAVAANNNMLQTTIGTFDLSSGQSGNALQLPQQVTLTGKATLQVGRPAGLPAATVNVCVQYSFALPANSSDWSARTCSVFAAVTLPENASLGVSAFTFLDVTATYGIYLVSGPRANYTLSLTGNGCTQQDGVATPSGDCVQPQPIHNGLAFPVAAASFNYFTVSVPTPDTAGVTLTFVQNGVPAAPAAAPVAPQPSPVAAPVAPEPTPVVAPVAAPVDVPAPVAAPVAVAEPVAAPAARRRSVNLDDSTQAPTIFIRFASAPQFDGTDDYAVPLAGPTTTIVIPAPLVGTWYVAVNNSIGTASFNLTGTAAGPCNGTLAGPECSATFAPYLGNSSSVSGPAALALNQSANGLTFFRLARASLNNGSFVVSVSGLRAEKSQSNFTMYLAVGGAPNPNTPIWTGCTAGECSFVQVASFANSFTVAGDIWVGVKGTNATADSILVWRDSTCANNCNNQGTCQTDVSQKLYGLCACGNGYAGADCSIAPTGLPVQVIVLIIIGSLLVLTVLIGLIAWIVSRRSQRAGYQSV